MNADRLLAQYDRIAESPDAVHRLRRVILKLALGGKLVPPDPNDEPTSKLLARIVAGRARLATTDDDGEPNRFVRIDRNALPFQPPPHWCWARLIDVAHPSYGFAFPSGQFTKTKRGMPLIRIRDISDTDTEVYFDGDYDPSYLVTSGDYLVGMDGNFNLRQWRGKDGLLNQRVMRINGWRYHIDPEFAVLPLQFILDHIHGETSQTTVKHLSAKQVNGIELPLPPLGEQHRIVAKIAELMALCDRLEAAMAEREAKRDRFAMATLAGLNAPDPQTFQRDVGFALEQIASVTTRPEQISQLRHAILNLAVRGKLVSQKLKDEPATVLLERIRNLREDDTEQVTPESEPFGLPATWAWARLGALCTKTGSGSTPRGGRAAYHAAGVPFLRSQNVHDDGLRLRDVVYIDRETHHRMRGTAVKPNDLLLNITGGSIGRCCVVPNEFLDANVSQHVAIVRVALAETQKFLHWLILSPYFQEFVLGWQTGAGRGGLPKRRMDQIPVALPPLAEQHRIVAKVDEIMELCVRLEAALAEREALRNRLFSALVSEAPTQAA